MTWDATMTRDAFTLSEKDYFYCPESLIPRMYEVVNFIVEAYQEHLNTKKYDKVFVVQVPE